MQTQRKLIVQGLSVELFYIHKKKHIVSWVSHMIIYENQNPNTEIKHFIEIVMNEMNSVYVVHDLKSLMHGNGLRCTTYD